MDIKEMVERAWNNKSLAEIRDATVSALQGVGEKGQEVLQSVLNVASVEDLAQNKYVQNAQEIVAGTIKNIKDTVDTSWENKDLQDIANASLEVLQGISPEGAKKLREVLNIETIKDLAENDHVQNAQKIVDEA